MCQSPFTGLNLAAPFLPKCAHLSASAIAGLQFAWRFNHFLPNRSSIASFTALAASVAPRLRSLFRTQSLASPVVMSPLLLGLTRSSLCKMESYLSKFSTGECRKDVSFANWAAKESMYGHIKEDGITVSSDEDDHANILSPTKAMAKYLQTLKRVQRDRCRPRVGFAQELHVLGEREALWRI